MSKFTELASKIYMSRSKPLEKRIAWFPTKMTDGEWIWLKIYWYSAPDYLLGLHQFKCSDQRKLLLILKGCIINGKLSQTFAASIGNRHRKA